MILLPARTLDTILFFSDRGKVYSEKVYRIPDASRTAKGVPMVNVLAMGPNETVTAAVRVRDFKAAEYCMMVTRNGTAKRIALSEFAAVRPSGLIAINLADDDSLGWARLTTGKDDVMVVTERGRALRFSEDNVRAMGRQAAGVIGIRLKGKDKVTSMEIAEKDGDLLVVTMNGYGKRTPLAEYATKGRGTMGVLTLDDKAIPVVGQIASARVVQEPDELTIISTNGVVIRTTVKEIKQAGRATRGVRVMNLQKGDTVASLARIAAADLKEVAAEGQENGTG
jgi:DNA gyrase subunit A